MSHPLLDKPAVAPEIKTLKMHLERLTKSILTRCVSEGFDRIPSLTQRVVIGVLRSRHTLNHRTDTLD